MTTAAVAADREPLPARVVSLVGVIGLVGLLACACAWAVALGEPLGWDVAGRAAAVAVVVLVGDVALLQIRLGRNGNGFTWAEASLIVGVAIGGWAWLVAVLGPVVLVRQLAAHRPAHKAVFNAGSAVLAAGLAWVAHGVISGRWAGVPTPVTWRAALGLAVAAAVYSLAISVQVSTAVAWAQGLQVRHVWSRGLRLRTVMFLGNSLVALLAVLVGQWSRPTILVLPFFLILLYGCYNGALLAQQERDLWRELHAISLTLDRVDPNVLLTGLQDGARTLFGAECTALLLAEDVGLDTVRAPALLARGCGLTAPRMVDVDLEAPPVADELRRLGLVTAALAPLPGGSGARGALLVGYRGPVRLRRGELEMVGTFAAQSAISLQHAVLFDEVDAQRSRLSVILDNASDGILLVDAGGTVRSWNPAMARLTGRSEADAVGAPLRSVLPGSLDDGAPLDVAELFSPGRSEVCGRIAVADHGHRDVSLTLATVEAADAEYAVVVARDITAQREVQQAKEDFIATVSHELRTPLTPIKGYLRLLQRPGYADDPARRDDALVVLVQQAEQLERLVEDLLSVSRMRHGHFDVLPEVCDVDDVVARAVRDLGVSSVREVRHARAATPATARCDPARLQQVVANLLSNADKYSPAGRPVDVTVTASELDVEIVVTDAGTGVPPESRAAVFEPFQRLGHHLTRRTRGTGLGLHIAQRLVTAMDGRIWVDGRPGDGASFHVTVPTATVPTTGPTTTATGPTTTVTAPAPRRELAAP